MSSDLSRPEGMVDPAVCYRCGNEHEADFGDCPSCGTSADARGGIRPVLRWAAMLPAAVLASGLAAMWMEFVAWGAHSDSSAGLLGLVRAGLMGAAFVLVGSYVAPKARPAVPFSLASVYCAASVLLVYVLFRSGFVPYPSPGWSITCVVVAIAAAFGAALYEAS